MSISNKLGSEYQSIRAASKYKTITVKLNDVVFPLKVRIPVKREMEAITASITDPLSTQIDAIYETLSAPLRKTLDSTDEGFLAAINAEKPRFVISDDDIEVDGTSIRHLARMTAVWQVQVEKYFSLLESATGEPITESYAEIAEEFPENIIREIIMQIDEVIRPNYKDTKKN